MYTSLGLLRVSTQKQGLIGDSPDDQKNKILLRARDLHVIPEDIHWLKYTESASGAIETQPVLGLINYCRDHPGEIKYCFISVIDRFTRGGAFVYESLLTQLTSYGVTLIDAEKVINLEKVNTLAHLGVDYNWSQYNPSHKNELLEAEKAKDEVRKILTRTVGAEIIYARLGFGVREAPLGLKNVKIDTPHGKRVVRTPEPTESKWFTRMFELNAQGNLSDEKIVLDINNLGYKSRVRNKHDKKDRTKVIGHTGGVCLNVEQMRRHIRNPIYAGVICEKWTGLKPVYCPEQALVSIELFNAANKGKVTLINDGSEIRVLKSLLPKWKAVKNKNNPLYPFKYVGCSICNKPLLGSGSKGGTGRRYAAYHCGRNHKRFGVNLGDFNETVKKFTQSVKFSDDFTERFKETVLSEWEKRERGLSNDTITLSQQAVQKEKDIQELKDRIKIMTSPIVIEELGRDLERMLLEKASLVGVRDKKEDEQLDIQIVINYTKYFMEHPAELILGSDNQATNANLFKLLFKERPTYDDLKNGTARLNCVFALSKDQSMPQKQLVTPVRIERTTPSLKGMCSTTELRGQVNAYFKANY